MFLLVKIFITMSMGILFQKIRDSFPYLKRPEVFIRERDKRKPETALRLPQFGSEC